jgi:hypothetical protein
MAADPERIGHRFATRLAKTIGNRAKEARRRAEE